jgi:hypothetical protein
MVQAELNINELVSGQPFRSSITAVYLPDLDDPGRASASSRQGSPADSSWPNTRQSATPNSLEQLGTPHPPAGAGTEPDLEVEGDGPAQSRHARSRPTRQVPVHVQFCTEAGSPLTTSCSGPRCR